MKRSAEDSSLTNCPFRKLAVGPSCHDSVRSSPSTAPIHEVTDIQRMTRGERLPSIRLKRNAQQKPLDKAPTAGPVPVPDNPYSLSHPNPVALPPSNASVLITSRRVSHNALPRLTEEGPRPEIVELDVLKSPHHDTASARDENINPPNDGRQGRLSKLTRMRPGSFRRTLPPDEQSVVKSPRAPAVHEYRDSMVDFLDVVDPEIQTLSTLTNVQNSLFVPDLGSLIDRRPAYSLSELTHIDTSADPLPSPLCHGQVDLGQDAQLERAPTIKASLTEGERREMPELRRSNTITSHLSETHYATLPHGLILDGWTDQEKRELDDRVRHMLHSRRSRLKRTMKGFGQYVRRPLGFLVTLYSVLITLFGLAWVLFLIGWIYVGDHQVYAIHIIDSVLVALFAVVGDGLAPFRAVDTYHMVFVIHYTRKIQKARKQVQPQGARQQEIAPSGPSDAVKLNPLKGDGKALGATSLPSNLVCPYMSIGNHGDSPKRVGQKKGDMKDLRPISTLDVDLEQNLDFQLTKKTMDRQDDTCLTAAQHKTMRSHQRKLARSHSFYKPYETFTHHPFPLSFLVAIVILLDCHSCLQISLGATTWGIDYHHRPPAITTTILCLSITANLMSALVITLGDRRTRKKEVVKLIERQKLTADAIQHLESRRASERDAYKSSDGCEAEE